MASIKTYQRQDGTVTYRVTWQLGGSREGAWQSEPFGADEGAAKVFKAMVEAAGHHWPDNWLPGVGLVDQAQIAAAARESSTQDASGPLLFRDHALHVIAHTTGVEERTRRDYERMVDNHMGRWHDWDVLATSGERALVRDRVAEWVQWLQDGERDPADPARWRREVVNGTVIIREPKSPKTIANHHGLLFTLMQALVDDGRRSDNPCVGTGLPRLDDKRRGRDSDWDEDDENAEMFVLEPDDFELLASNFDDQAAEDLARMIYETGTRWSEATSWQPRDRDPKTRRLRVRRAWKRQADNTERLGPPKSPMSRRDFPLSTRAEAIWARQSAGKERRDFVFKPPRAKRWRHSNYYHNRWLPAVYRSCRCAKHRAEDLRERHIAPRRSRGVKKITRADVVPCGCPGTLPRVPRIHDLRHSFAARLVSKGIPIGRVSRILGHESVVTTERIYVHYLPHVDEDIVAVLDAGIVTEPPALRLA